MSLWWNSFKRSDLCEVYLFWVHTSWFSDQNASWKGIYCPWEPFKVQLQVRHQWQSKASLSAFDNQSLRGGSHAPERYLTLSCSSHTSTPSLIVLSAPCVFSNIHDHAASVILEYLNGKPKAEGNHPTMKFSGPLRMLRQSSINLAPSVPSPSLLQFLPFLFPLQNSYGEQMTWQFTQNGKYGGLF